MVPGLGIQYPNWRYLSTTYSKVHGTKVLGYHGIIGYHSTCGATGHHWVPQVPQYLGTTVPLGAIVHFLGTTGIGYHSTWVQQYLGTTELGYHCTWVPQQYHWYCSTWVPWYHSILVPQSLSTTALGYNSTWVP